MKVGVYGDPMRDVYWCGTADRLSPEAPIPVVRVKEKLEFPGGAANVAAGLEALGVEVVKAYNSLDCPAKNRLMVEDYQLARWDEYDRCIPVDLPMKDVDAIVVSDYSKGGTTEHIRQNVYKLGLPVFVDTKDNPSLWHFPHTVAVFPNEKEYQRYPEEYDRFRLCVVKQGAQGVILLSYGKVWLRIPAKAKKVVSVNGAGDTVLAAFTYRWLKDGGSESMVNRAVNFANDAAAVAVGKRYTSTVTLKEIERFQNDH